MSEGNAAVEVTQADRDAAWNFMPELYRTTEPSAIEKLWHQGVYDTIPIIQAFARHRLSGATSDETARLRVHIEKMQDMMRLYNEPVTYIAAFPDDATKWASEFPEPTEHDTGTNAETKRRRMDRAFIGDIIRMLDGPEQRALQSQDQS